MNPQKQGRELVDYPYEPYDDPYLPMPGRVPVTARLFPSPNQAVAQAASSSGSTLPDELRLRFESCLDTDLSGVRIHTGESSANAAAAVNARAYTTGQDIHFAAGQFDPGSSSGMHLLAHEVAHTVQQAGRPVVQAKLEVSAPGDSHEVEADAFADAFVSGGSAPVRAASVDPVISRVPDTEPKPMFQPKVTTMPAMLFADLNDEVSLRTTVTNADSAPPGTKFKWTWPTGSGKVVKTLSGDPAGPSSDFTGKTIGVGSQTLPVELQIEEGDAPGLAVSHPVKAPEVTVEEPTVEWSEIYVGKGGDIGSMRPGDSFTTEATIGGVIDAIAFSEISAALSGQSSSMNWGSVPEAIRPPSVSDDGEAFTIDKAPAGGPDSVAWVITANRAGSANLTLTIKIPGVATHTSEMTFKSATTSEEFLKRCPMAIARHMSLVSVITSYYNALTAAYNEGHRRYEAALAERAATEKLEQEILMGILFAGCGGFAGGVAGGMLKGPLKSLSDMPQGGLTDAAKDLVKYSARLGAKAGGSGVSKGSKDVPKDPLTWASEMQQKGNLEHAAVSEIIKGWMEAAEDAPPDKRFDFDPVDAVNDATSINGARVDNLGSIPTAEVYEQQFWYAWLQQYGYKTVSLGLTPYKGALQNTGSAVDERLDAIDKHMKDLGVESGWRGDAIGVSREKAEKEAHENNRDVEENQFFVPIL